MRRSARDSWFALAFAGLSSCAADPDRPAPAPVCDPSSMDCVAQPPISGGGGSANDGGAGAAGLVNVLGEIGIYNDDRFDPSAGSLYQKSAIVEGDAQGGRVRADWDGSTPYVLQGLAAALENWLSVAPVLVDDDAILTLHPVDTTSADDVDLFLVRPSVLDEIFGVVPIPVDRLLTRGHAVLFIRDATSLEPLAGVRVVQPQSELVAYALNGIWSDTDLDETSDQGLVLLGNVEAGDYPSGSPRQVTLSGAVSGSAEVKVVRNGVTVADVFVTR